MIDMMLARMLEWLKALKCNSLAATAHRLAWSELR